MVCDSGTGWSLSRKQVQSDALVIHPQRTLLENLLMTLLTMLPVLSVES